MWQSVGTGTSPADQLHWEGSTTARLLPLHQAAALNAFVPCQVGSKSCQKKRGLSHIAERRTRNQMGL